MQCYTASLKPGTEPKKQDHHTAMLTILALKTKHHQEEERFRLQRNLGKLLLVILGPRGGPGAAAARHHS